MENQIGIDISFVDDAPRRDQCGHLTGTSTGTDAGLGFVAMPEGQFAKRVDSLDTRIDPAGLISFWIEPTSDAALVGAVAAPATRAWSPPLR